MPVTVAVFRAYVFSQRLDNPLSGFNVHYAALVGMLLLSGISLTLMKETIDVMKRGFYDSTPGSAA